MNTPLSGERFPSRRSIVMSRNGIVSTTQPLASMAGLRILMQGGNAFDAAVAASAAMNVTEPMTNGIGGDMFSLNYVAETRKVTALNGSGRAPQKATAKWYRDHGHDKMPQLGILAVTVPGAVDGWATLLNGHGTMSLGQVLQPAIELASEGFPVQEMTAKAWLGVGERIKNCADAVKTYWPNGRAPRAGELFRNPNLARSLRMIADQGRDAYYLGEIAEKIVNCSDENGGLFTLQDFIDHTSTWDEPITADYGGYRVYECPPNGQGIAALMALNLVKGFDLKALGHLSADYLHVLMEAMKIAFADAKKYIADPRMADVPIAGLLSAAYADERRKLIDMKRAAPENLPGKPPAGSSTEYHSVADRWGNACSFICSNYMGIGSGLVAGDTGIALQNRGALFVLDSTHRNVIAPAKRPYHTIIPAMAVPLDDALPYRVISFGVMGGFMQPQGHMQVMCNLADFGLNVQESLDVPRFRVDDGAAAGIEPGVPEPVRAELTARGHKLTVSPWWSPAFGRGQVVAVDRESGAILAGSEPRSDGCAVGW
ncbi:MAG: gamma-glutamyltransferase [Chloroflexi bacterium]|nr:gamma-glutamyltransferase [Chloroflexota bacterium]